jgi:predicted XRE-type DNA-binding protein
MVVNMNDDLTPADRKLILNLGIITQEIGIMQHDMSIRRATQKALVVDLVTREILSQARAARIAEIQRQTVTSWVNSWPGDVNPV